ncbi:hypothetical protein RQM47_11265 [Rubrivirga sp. S365]|uniref:PH domain-containing protein n=1 Tax=Rubrivirga litoralis TaxID=3075598 RepID=A0ABU3BQK5_9BACT|nr:MULTISPECIES: hypothetical protein [unclassified Rubrivirga]MDT0631573.1 hypothetical protein [Rubrivirga sp. F394]MDT7857218.1 hypothetical protein [Rubrivirga sp. S365]
MDPAPPRSQAAPPRPPLGGAVVFASVHHPGVVGRPYLALEAQARPVALALLVVMTVGLAAALQGEAILWPFVTGTALAYALAAAYGQSTLVRTPAEVEVRGPFAAVRSVWSVAGARGRGGLAPVHSARLVHGELLVGLGDYVTTLRREDWPDFDGLVDALRGAAGAGRALAGGAG